MKRLSALATKSNVSDQERTLAQQKVTDANSYKERAAKLGLPYWDWINKDINAIYINDGNATARPFQTTQARSGMGVIGGPVKQRSSQNREVLAKSWATIVSYSDPDTFWGSVPSFEQDSGVEEYPANGLAGAAAHMIPHNNAGGWLANVKHS
jgi:hypothetical protein